jgi:D-alanine-D-alanine ligase
MRVAILHNAVPDDAPLEDQDTLVQVETVSAALARLGHESVAIACTLNLAALRDDLLRMRPDVVFNLVESLNGDDSLVYLPLAVLDSLHIPYTGGRTEALFLTTHKLLAKQRLRQAGLPTPDWLESGIKPRPVVALPGATTGRGFIIKGVWDQASRDMSDDAVLHNADPAEVQRRLCVRAEQTGRPCFAEQFIEGREFNLSVLTGPDGPEILPPAEIDFSAFPPGKPRIVGHRAKWQADSFEYNNTPRRFPSDRADGPLLQELCRLAKECWRLFALRGWARVDFRVDSADQPWILEINANPCLSPDAGFSAALRQAAIPFDTAIKRILKEIV